MNEPLLAKQELFTIQESELSMMPQKLPTQNALGCITIGETPLPIIEPNIHPNREIEDIENSIRYTKASGLNCCDIATMTLTSLTVIGACFVSKNTVLINRNQYGFIVNSGR